ADEVTRCFARGERVQTQDDVLIIHPAVEHRGRLPRLSDVDAVQLAKALRKATQWLDLDLASRAKDADDLADGDPLVCRGRLRRPPRRQLPRAPAPRPGARPRPRAWQPALRCAPVPAPCGPACLPAAALPTP